MSNEKQGQTTFSSGTRLAGENVVCPCFSYPPPMEPKREELEAMPGPVMLEFGTSWCGHCRRAQPVIAEALGARPGVRHIKIEDAAGKRLGRSFGVKLWPTLVFLKDGKEAAKLVRPRGAEEILKELEKIQV
jgi:thioredoxin 1